MVNWGPYLPMERHHVIFMGLWISGFGGRTAGKNLAIERGDFVFWVDSLLSL